jgi:electron transport complex protein RnfE
MKKTLKQLLDGIFTNNPVLVQLIGMCPTLATTTSVLNALGMGVASTAVLICSNIAISALRKTIPEKVRIPSYIVLIAGFVTIIEMLMHAFVPDLYESLGVFLSLIVVNCIILGRA